MSSIQQCKWLYNNGQLPECIFFFRPNDPAGVFSQWFKSDFSDGRLTYTTAEQYMMAAKAELFGDKEVIDMVMAESNPANIKKMGRLVKNFDQDVWDNEKYSIVLKGNVLKFSQNEFLTRSLLETEDAVLVEASPYDDVWGIKLGTNSPGIENPYNWKGKNLLGFALMDARDIIRMSYI